MISTNEMTFNQIMTAAGFDKEDSTMWMLQDDYIIVVEYLDRAKEEGVIYSVNSSDFFQQLWSSFDELNELLG